MNVNTNGITRKSLILIMLVSSVLMLLWAAGCTSAPSETPEKFVLKFLQRQVPMIDRSVADFYVKNERPGVIDRVQEFIASMKEKGKLESLKNASYDLSNIKVNVLDQKDEYINDEEVKVVEVAAKGDYTKTVNGKSQSLTADKIIVLQSVAGKWKVTEKVTPWK